MLPMLAQYKAMRSSRKKASEFEIINFTKRSLGTHNVRLLNKLAYGVSSENYLMESLQRLYVVRIDYYRTSDQLLLDDYYRCAAKNMGISVPPKYINVEQTFDKTFAIRSFEFGTPIQSAEMLSRSDWEVIFGWMAAMSSAEPCTERPYFYSHAFSNDFLEDIELGAQWISYRQRSVINIALKALRDAVPSSFVNSEKCFVHSDLKVDNILRKPSGDLCLLDWDKSTIASRRVDIGLSLFHLMPSVESKQAEFFKTLNPFLKRLAIDQLSINMLMLCSGSLFLVTDFYLSGSESHPPDRVSQHRAYFHEYCLPKYERLLKALDQMFV